MEIELFYYYILFYFSARPELGKSLNIMTEILNSTHLFIKKFLGRMAMMLEMKIKESSL